MDRVWIENGLFILFKISRLFLYMSVKNDKKAKFRVTKAMLKRLK